MISESAWRRVDVDSSGRGVIRVGESEIAVFLVDGIPYALANACPHAGNPLVHGDILGRTIVCAYHGWRFDLETGSCVSGDEAARRYPAELRGGDVWVNGAGSL